MQSRMFLGRYEAVRLLGEGGMGKVYLARQSDLGRQVVVKVMHEHIAADPKFRDRFQRETLVMARFQHPCCVTLFDASLNDPNGPCIVMEYVKGTNLETLLRKNGKFTPARVGRIIAQLCDVLQAAHDEGIIHRDLKPANLMVIEPDTPRERIKVMDFGLAKLADEGPTAPVTDTAVDFAVGTPGYIAPEQIRGEVMDHRGDIYSVGAMLFELMSGRLPFLGSTCMDVLLAHATEAPPTFAELGLEEWVPTAIEELVRDCLAKDPSERPQSARLLGDRFAAGLVRRTGKTGSDSSHLSIPRDQFAPSAARKSSSNYSIPQRDEPDSDSDVVPLSATGMTAVAAPPAASLSATASNGLLADPSTQPTPLPNAVRDASALPFTMEAWMPESIALMKLRGFIQDFGGELIETQPGLVRMRLGRAVQRNSGAFSWLSVHRRNGPVDVELQFSRRDPRKENHLTIVVLFRPPVPGLLTDKGWRDRCTQLFIDLRAYLMGNAAT